MISSTFQMSQYKGRCQPVMKLPIFYIHLDQRVNPRESASVIVTHSHSSNGPAGCCVQHQPIALLIMRRFTLISRCSTSMWLSMLVQQSFSFPMGCPIFPED